MRRHSVSITICAVFALLGLGTASSDEEGEGAQPTAANPPGQGTQQAEGEGGGETLRSCDLSETSAKVCMQYLLSEASSEAALREQCESVQVLSDDKVPLRAGPCPTENLAARCEPRFGNTQRFIYEDPAMGDAMMELERTMCTGTFHTE
jgi:hypothetical protein